MPRPFFEKNMGVEESGKKMYRIRFENSAFFYGKKVDNSRLQRYNI